MNMSTTHGPHLPLGGESLHRAVMSGIVVLVLALLVYLLGLLLTAPHTTVIS